MEKTEKKEDTFEKELAWAIEQLELGMKRVGTTEDQKKESLSVITKLKSTKKPKVEKIVLMKSVFGDYIKWMKITEEEKQKAEAEKLKKQKKKENQKKKKEEKREGKEEGKEEKKEIEEKKEEVKEELKTEI